MKTMISVVSLAVVTTWVPTSWANTSATEQAHNSPTLTWNRIALEAVERAKPNQLQALRLLAYVSLAQYAAFAETKHESNDAVATSSMRVIGGLFPSQVAFVEDRHRQHVPRAADTELPVARHLLAEAQQDRFSQTWTGQAPQAPFTWRSLVNPPAPPALPALGAMRTFLVDSGSVFRSAPPPAHDSTRFRDDLAEVRRHTAASTEESTRIAKFYDMTTGTLVAGFWNERATELIRKNAVGELQAARVLATMNVAMMDAAISCHDTKYTYWVPRPSQADTSIKPLISVPNHPSYPSNHSCISTAAGLVLAHFFPQDRGRLEAIAVEAGISRIYAGLHFRFDVDAGEEIGRKVANVAIARHDSVLARWTRTLIARN
ncbi:MAG: vanadium-dependent haloperoxidase [Burkholderiales bacterium]